MTISTEFESIPANPFELPSSARYRAHLHATGEWLLRSIKYGHGGSSAHYTPILGWSRPYPETSGYIIPTLLALADEFGDTRYEAAAIGLGRWLLGNQSTSGYWCGGLHPPRRGAGRPSVFNTAQVLTGLTALSRRYREDVWLQGARAGGSWLVKQLNEQGEWAAGDYRASMMPSYYTHAAAPLLDVWALSGDDKLRSAGEAVCRAVLARRCENHSFRAWGFEETRPAVTHTIAYTLSGLLEAARLLDDWTTFGAPTVDALEILYRKAELHGGALPGAFDQNWRAHGNSVCLTGNAQIALCLLTLEARVTDLRLVNSAAKLVDYVCARQLVFKNAPASVRGGVLGSFPPWGRYMMFRYPNWAAKYHCDALLALMRRIANLS